MTVIEKVILKVGKKRIELTQAEYEELKQHFTDKEWIPYPVYPQPISPTPNPFWSPSYPIITSGTDTGTTAGEFFNA